MIPTPVNLLFTINSDEKSELSLSLPKNLENLQKRKNKMRKRVGLPPDKH